MAFTPVPSAMKVLTERYDPDLKLKIDEASKNTWWHEYAVPHAGVRDKKVKRRRAKEYDKIFNSHAVGCTTLLVSQ